MQEAKCQCCGVDSRDAYLTLTMTREHTEILCDRCERWIKDGLIRPETVDGQLRYRRWHYNIQPMTPGELPPAVTQEP